MEFPVVIIGGGPAGSAAGRLLASWGCRVLLLDDRSTSAADARGLAESLPPSSRKILAQTTLLDRVERAGFYRSTGNTVCWGADDLRVETFAGGAVGFQIFRPDFDRLLLNAARDAGVSVQNSAHVHKVEFEDASATVHYRRGGEPAVARASWVLDCSGRAGVLARHHRRADRRTYALVGEWSTDRAWRMPDQTHTLVEAYAGGWSWSIPISATLRHVGVMIDGASPRRDGRDLAGAYRAELDQSVAVCGAMRDAELQRVWACDASTYSAAQCAGNGFLLVGDAASFVDPLSSAGVKKALTSAWLAAIVVNTCLADRQRRDAALSFFSDWERGVSATHARRSRQFAVEAAARWPTPFWCPRAEALADEGDGAERVPAAAVQAALRAIRECDELELALDDGVAFERRPVVRGREIVLDEALVPPGRRRGNASTEPTRFVDNVDVVTLARLAGSHQSVPALFEAYCQLCGPAPLPNVLGGLSWLVAAGVLRQRNPVPC